MSDEKNLGEMGNVKISEEVIGLLAEKAIKNIDGVVGLASNVVESLVAMVSRKNNVKGVSADIKNENVSITLHTVIRFGVRIPEVAWQIQENVKTVVESMTGLNVDKVNVCVDGVQFPEDEPVEEAPAEETAE
ncbi:MAG: Asp23/Gls24 family envelope stress response protein [Clostridia bacterium]|nr:Asp23/Gls24 family envelope stress response protein [Clostridia bacterium]MBR2973429.1 Asp23/Gls24 family envelope stress response protein [Clostridia bacterium]